MKKVDLIGFSLVLGLGGILMVLGGMSPLSAIGVLVTAVCAAEIMRWSHE